MAVYIFNVEKSGQRCLNKLLGHSAPVLDVCWNYDESQLASCDTEVSFAPLHVLSDAKKTSPRLLMFRYFPAPRALLGPTVY